MGKTKPSHDGLLQRQMRPTRSPYQGARTIPSPTSPDLVVLEEGEENVLACLEQTCWHIHLASGRIVKGEVFFSVMLELHLPNIVYRSHVCFVTVLRTWEEPWKELSLLL